MIWGECRLGIGRSFWCRESRGSGIELSWALAAHTLDLKRIEDARAAGIPVEGKVTGDNKGPPARPCRGCAAPRSSSR